MKAEAWQPGDRIRYVGPEHDGPLYPGRIGYVVAVAKEPGSVVAMFSQLRITVNKGDRRFKKFVPARQSSPD